jgi:hypothetical protein
VEINIFVDNNYLSMGQMHRSGGTQSEQKPLPKKTRFHHQSEKIRYEKA